MAGEPEILVGGQAVLEGVMMKMPRTWAVTVRRANGELVARSGDVAPLSERYPVLKLPVLRGAGVLGQMMVLGMRSLSFSADVAASDDPAGKGGAKPGAVKTALTLGSLLLLSAVADGPQGDEADADSQVVSGRRDAGAPSEADADAQVAPGRRDARAPSETDPTRGGLSNWELALSIGFALVMFVLVFKALPLGIAWAAGHFWPVLKAPLAESVISGLALAAVFVGYLFMMSQFKDIRRVFQYHGAEHEVVHAHESGQPVTVENARRFPTLHPRCGTSFLFFVVLTSIVVWSLFPLHIGYLGKLGLRLALLPLVVGLSFELIRLSARHRTNPFFRALMAPGLWSQRITTKKPDDGMLEVSIHSLEQAAARAARA